MPTIDEVYRDFATDGVPSSGDHDPVKSEIRALLTEMVDASGTINIPVDPNAMLEPPSIEGSRIYISTAGPHVIDSEDMFPKVHYIKYNGLVTLDVSALQLYQPYLISAYDYSAAQVILDAGLGKIFVGTADRDGYGASQSAKIRGGESVIVYRATGTDTVIVSETRNMDIVRIPGSTEVRAWEQPDGRYEMFYKGSVVAGASNVDVTIAGKTIDFTNAVATQAAIVEDNDTARDPIKLKSKSNNGATAGRLVVHNPNGVAVSAEFYLKDVEIT